MYHTRGSAPENPGDVVINPTKTTAKAKKEISDNISEILKNKAVGCS